MASLPGSKMTGYHSDWSLFFHVHKAQICPVAHKKGGSCSVSLWIIVRSRKLTRSLSKML